MVDVKELQRESLERSFRDFCEKLKSNDDLGLGLHPHNLWARGGAVTPGQTFADIDGKEFDRDSAQKLLVYLEDARRKFPEVASEFNKVLIKAESAWKSI